jgi:hypothetical protein
VVSVWEVVAAGTACRQAPELAGGRQWAAACGRGGIEFE